SPPAGAARLHLAGAAGAAAPRPAVPGAAPARPRRAAPPPAQLPRASAAEDTASPVSGPGPALACEGGDGAAAGWRVYLPRLPSADAAQATAARIAESGFSDYMVVRDGADANTIALGRYGTESAAQRRAASLRAAGFPARCARIPAATPA
ncbi:MAG: SPOR domain-containing protein, partial [Luteimonas sp.]